MNRMELDDLIGADRSPNSWRSLSRRWTAAVFRWPAFRPWPQSAAAPVPLITQRHLRTKVITTAHPQLTAAEGVALIAHRSQFVETATALAPAAPATATVAAAAFGTGAASTGVGALAWSEVEDGPHDALEAEPPFEDRYGPGPPTADRRCTSSTRSGKTRPRRVGVVRCCCSGCRQPPL